MSARVQNTSAKRIAVYGGSFDPIHLGHIKVAECARDQFELDRVDFLPAAIPPHKQNRQLAAASHRLHLIELAIQNRPKLAVDARELDRSGPSYSFDSMAEIKSESPWDQFYFLVGMDSLALLPSWHRIEELSAICEFLVVARPGADERLLAEAQRRQPGLRMQVLSAPVSDLSSTELRRRLRENRDCGEAMDKALLDYIREQGLYQELKD